MRIIRFLSFAAIVLAIFVTTATTQENSGTACSGGLPEYVLEVTRPEGCIVSPITPKCRYACLVYALPRPAKVAPDSSGRPVTSKVTVWAAQEGEQWRIRVAVGTGEFFDAGETQVGDFQLAVNQRATVTEVSKFGLSPIRVGVMKIVRQPIAKPEFTNLTQSVALETIDASNIPDPFKLALKNYSSRDLVALQYNTFNRNGFLDLKWFSSGLLKPLIKAGETYKLKVNSEDQSCGDEAGYRPNQLTRIDLVSAVFADGTYEGEPALPALVKGAALGNRKHLERVMQSIDNLTDAAALAQQLTSLADEMNEDTDDYLVNTLQGMFPSITNARDVLNNYIRSGMHEVKTNLRRDAAHLRDLSKSSNTALAQRGVETIKAKYVRWWTGAQTMISH